VQRCGIITDSGVRECQFYMSLSWNHSLVLLSCIYHRSQHGVSQIELHQRRRTARSPRCVDVVHVLVQNCLHFNNSLRRYSVLNFSGTCKSNAHHEVGKFPSFIFCHSWPCMRCVTSTHGLGIPNSMSVVRLRGRR